MTTSFREVVERLRALHELDAQIQEFEREIHDGPAKLDGLQIRVRDVDQKIKAVADRALVLKAQIKLRENELKSVEQKIERVKAQASEVKTNKEFMAYRAELANFQADADRLSGEVLKILDVVEQAEKKVESMDEERERARLRVVEAEHKVDESLDEVKKERDRLVEQRAARQEGIEKDLLREYERVRGTRGTSLAVLDGNYCSACMERLTRNDVFAVQNQSRLVQCGGCNRILVTEL